MISEKRRECMRKSANKRYKRLREAGLCVICGKRPAKEGRTRCAECTARVHARQSYAAMLERNRTMRRTRTAEGLCVTCGKPARPGHTQCFSCAIKKSEFRQRSYLKSKAGAER